jgi:hypothetical protein
MNRQQKIADDKERVESFQGFLGDALGGNPDVLRKMSEQMASKVKVHVVPAARKVRKPYRAWMQMDEFVFDSGVTAGLWFGKAFALMSIDIPVQSNYDAVNRRLKIKRSSFADLAEHCYWVGATSTYVTFQNIATFGKGESFIHPDEATRKKEADAAELDGADEEDLVDAQFFQDLLNTANRILREVSLPPLALTMQVGDWLEAVEKLHEQSSVALAAKIMLLT